MTRHISPRLPCNAQCPIAQQYHRSLHSSPQQHSRLALRLHHGTTHETMYWLDNSPSRWGQREHICSSALHKCSLLANQGVSMARDYADLRDSLTRQQQGIHIHALIASCACLQTLFFATLVATLSRASARSVPECYGLPAVTQLSKPQSEAPVTGARRPSTFLGTGITLTHHFCCPFRQDRVQTTMPGRLSRQLGR